MLCITCHIYIFHCIYWDVRHTNTLILILYQPAISCSLYIYIYNYIAPTSVNAPFCHSLFSSCSIISFGNDVVKFLIIKKTNGKTPSHHHIYYSVLAMFRVFYVVSSIIETKDLFVLIVEELSGSLKGHEGRLDMSLDSTEAKAFHIKTEGAPSSISHPS